MSWKSKDRASGAGPRNKLSYEGGGKVSVSVNSIVNSPKVQRQVGVVKKIAANNSGRSSKRT